MDLKGAITIARHIEGEVGEICHHGKFPMMTSVVVALVPNFSVFTIKTKVVNNTNKTSGNILIIVFVYFSCITSEMLQTPPPLSVCSNRVFPHR